LSHVHHYLWEIAHHPHYIPRIFRLELWSSNNGRLQPDQWHTHTSNLPLSEVAKTYPAIPFPQHLHPQTEFFTQCFNIFNHYARPDEGSEWAREVQKDVVPTMLGVLLLALTSLKELKCAASWLMDFPFFSNCRTGQVTMTFPEGWRHAYLGCVLKVLEKKLEVLEFPTNLGHMAFTPRPKALFDFRHFAHLRELSVPMSAIGYYQRAFRQAANPVNIFPRTLELLRISEATEFAANFLNNLCLALKRGKFPCLRRIEIYYKSPREVITGLADVSHCPDPASDVQKMCTDAGLAVLLYFPGTIMQGSLTQRSLWSLKEEGRLRFVELASWKARMGFFGTPEVMLEGETMETDPEGDVIMG
jgi:hypothetical protein